MGSSSSKTNNTQNISDYTFNNSLGASNPNEGYNTILNVANSPLTGGVNIEYVDKNAVKSAFDYATGVSNNEKSILSQLTETAKASQDSANAVSSQALESLRSVNPNVASVSSSNNTNMYLIIGVVAVLLVIGFIPHKGAK